MPEENIKIRNTGPNRKMVKDSERILTYHLELDYFFRGHLRQRLRNCKEKCFKSKNKNSELMFFQTKLQQAYHCADFLLAI